MSGLRRANTFGPPEILPADIEYDKDIDLIGKGSYGTVYRARCRGYEVAVKIPKEQNLDPVALDAFRREVNIMSINAHPNVVRLMGACTIPGSLQIVTERCHGDVESLIYDNTYKGTLFERLKLARDTASGMNWLHNLTDTIHGDLKPANLLVDLNGQVKIADFGFGQIKQAIVDEATVKGSVMWMAPEKMMRAPITEKIDVFSFGIILWQIIKREKPYKIEKYTNVKDFCEKVCFQNERPALDATIPLDLQMLMTDCWHTDPIKRCSFRDIVSRLNLILVDCILTTRSAAEFWKSKIIGVPNPTELLEYTEWVTFVRKLREEIGPVDEFSIAPIKQLLVEKIMVAGKECEGVTMVRFNQVEKWFGPFYLPEEGPGLIDHVNDLITKPWFHGEINQSSAESVLKGHQQGTFLIRLSSTDPACPFTLSVPKGHIKLERAYPSGITVQGTHYSTLESFVSANKDKLITPCPKNAPTDPGRYIKNFEL